MSAATKLSGLKGTSLHDAIRKITIYGGQAETFRELCYRLFSPPSNTATCLGRTPSSYPASQPTGSCNPTTQINSAPQPNPSPSIPASASHPVPVTATAAMAPEISTSTSVPTPATVVQLRLTAPSSSPALPPSSWRPIWRVHGNPSIAASRSRAPLSLQPLPHQAPQLSSPFAAAATLTATRHLSVQPEATVYSGPSARNPARVTLRTIRKKYDAGEPLTMVTAYDYPSAVHVEAAGIDILLVGDSAAMVVHGHDTTLPISMEDMLAHCKAVARGARRAFLVGDLPFGCYETDVRDAVRSAVRMLKEGGMDAVKLEGGSPARVEAARAIVETGVAVMGHVGLTPQSVSVIGGFRPQAQVADEALRVLDQALALQRAGCFALVLECIPGPIAAAISRSLRIPTIGIGAGGECSGQVLVYHDLLGMMSHPHHAKVTPKFCKQYARVGDIIGEALERYRQEVMDGTFPGSRFSPYKISDQEVANLAEALRGRGLEEAAKAVEDEAQRAAVARTATATTAAGTAPVNTSAAAPAGSGGDAAGGCRSGGPLEASDKGTVCDAK